MLVLVLFTMIKSSFLLPVQLAFFHFGQFFIPQNPFHGFTSGGTGRLALTSMLLGTLYAAR
jgi:hypothetical protein